MKEYIIHKDSRLLYTNVAETFIYVCHHNEVVLFGTEQIVFQDYQSPQKEGDIVILKKHGIYTFYLPANGCLLLTNLNFLFETSISRFYQSPFQHEEIKNCCIMIADIDSKLNRKERFLLASYLNRLGYLILNYFSYHEDGIVEKNIYENQRI